MRLHTPRLLLRDFVPDDWKAVQEYAADAEAVRYRPFGPCTDEETRAVIREAARQTHLPQRGLYDLAIVLAAEDRLIGGCDIGLLVTDPCEASIGYGLSRAYWGRGYGTEAARALLAFGFRGLGAERISADVDSDNGASQRVLEKIGLRCAGQGLQRIKGEQRIVRHYAITAEEWVTLGGTVTAVSSGTAHTFSKANQTSIRLIAGQGVEGDAHCGTTVRHRSRVARDPSQPNLRQVHLIHAELQDELRAAGFIVEAGQLGENVTTRGVDLLALPAGARLHLGETAVVEVTGLRNPCGQLDGFQKGLTAALLGRDAQGGLVRKAGVMGVVIAGGEVHPGDSVRVETPTGPHRALECI